MFFFLPAFVAYLFAFVSPACMTLLFHLPAFLNVLVRSYNKLSIIFLLVYVLTCLSVSYLSVYFPVPAVCFTLSSCRLS